MATTAETYGFGARAPYAAPRASEHDMKERARLSGLLPRVNDEPLSKKKAGAKAMLPCLRPRLQAEGATDQAQIREEAVPR